jgi:ribonuclease Z
MPCSSSLPAVTHLHGDHVLGLPGLILSIQLVAKATLSAPKKRRKGEKTLPSASAAQRPQTVLEVYGPEGLHEYIATVLRLTHTDLKFLRVEVNELTGTANSISNRNKLPPRGNTHNRHSFEGSPRSSSSIRLPPSLHRNLIRKEIPRNNDGTWTLETPIEYTTPEEAAMLSSCRSRWVGSRGVYVTAAEVHHLPKLTCFGFVVKEPVTQPRTIDVARAVAAGVKPGTKYNQLKYGFAVESDSDPSIMVHPDQVLTGPPKASRSVAVLGDCCAVPGPMSTLCRHVDVLVHEATLIGDQDPQSGTLGLNNKSIFGGHSTAAMAGSVARIVQPKVLLLNHIAPTVRVRRAESTLAQEAERQLDGENRSENFSSHLLKALKHPSLTSPLSSQSSSETPLERKTCVQVGYDHLELMVPRDGFPW